MRLRKVARTLLVTGIVACAAGVGAGVLAGGVPYHDGPNAGHTSPPGPRRALEVASGPITLAGFAIMAAGACGMCVAVGVAATRRRTQR